MVMRRQGHAPCMRSTSKNPHGSQLLLAPTNLKVGLVTPAYHEWMVLPCILRHASIACCMMEGLMGAFGVQVVMWNLGSLSGNGGEVCEELRKRTIDVCCLQEVR